MFASIGRLLARFRRTFLVRRFHRAILALHRGTENLNYDPKSNGEEWLLKTIAANRSLETIFDIGANRGDWCCAAIKWFPTTDIHAFEIIPSTYQQLVAAVTRFKTVHPINTGLSDCEGMIEVYFDPEKDAVATSVPDISERFHGYKPQTKILPVTTGDTYCAQQGIRHIDFLKIDVEGHEPKVLKGFERMLKARAIDMIQFEYGYVNIETGFLLKHFYDYLEPFGMKIGKIFPNYVEFRPYKYMHEDFYGPNFLAIRAENQELINRLNSQS